MYNDIYGWYCTVTGQKGARYSPILCLLPGVERKTTLPIYLAVRLKTM